MTPEHRLFDRLRVFVSSRMIEMRPERDRVRAALDELKVEAWVYERDADADNLILAPASKSATIHARLRLSKEVPMGKIPNERGREFKGRRSGCMNVAHHLESFDGKD